ncbi:hypothetical protein MKX03_034241 [Papaver bracteatum]|nr:hypothetical protein MKX03_034241 [Papaver bracteatum]
MCIRLTGYDEQIEDLLDEAYEKYITRTEGSSQQRKSSKKAFVEKELYKGDDAVELDHDSDREMVANEANPLMISLQEEEAQTQEQVTQQWFNQDIFAEAAEVENISGEKESDNKMEVDVKENMPLHSNNSELPKTRVSKAADDDFEVVPAAITDSSDDSSASSSSNESEEEDNDKKAEILASAKKMLRKKQREALPDDAYNRYMFDDDKLPPWFLEEEKRHTQQMKPVTKEEIALMKAHFKEIDARTPKKVAQAKARKKRVALRQRENVKRKANAISDQTDITDMSKSKMIDKLYRKAVPKRPKKEYVVAKKGVQVKAPGKGKVLVDRRMKKDKKAGMR